VFEPASGGEWRGHPSLALFVIALSANQPTGWLRLTAWDNRSVRILVLLLVFSVLAPLGVVLAIHRWQDKLVEQAPPQPATSAVTTAESGSQAGRLRLARIGSFQEPVYVTAPPNDGKRLFVVEKAGRIRVLVNGRRKTRPFLDISGDTSKSGEQGLLSMAFAPDYASSGKFYVDFTNRDGNTRIQEFRRSQASPNRASRSSRRTLLSINQPFENHNGGLVLFGPDKLLYIGMGDGGDAADPGNRAQDRDSLLGKMLRIDPRPSGGRGYTIPASNPFVGRDGRDEIYSTGLRNPWRFSFDRNNGDLYIGDVGQDSYEEVDYAPVGSANGVDYGWSCREGKHSFNDSRSCPNPVGPVLETSHGDGNCSITGGVVVRDPALPGLNGRYVYGDYCKGRLFSFKIAGDRADDNRPLFGLTVPSLTSFGEDGRGRVYAASQNGSVFRLQD
jgi:glucose/arabinose dehydrogenase